MKRAGKNSLFLKIGLIAVIVIALIVINRVNEGFQTGTVVNLYFNLDATGKPVLISSDDAGVTFMSSSVGGNAVVNIGSALGPLKGFSGSGWSQANKWVPLTAAKLDKASNALYIEGQVGSSLKKLHLAAYKPAPALTSTTESVLPKQVSQITIRGLDTATFGLGTNAGDPANGAAKMLVTLTF